MVRGVRTEGSVSTPGAPSLSDHVCWTYGSSTEFDCYRRAAVAFLAEGRSLGQRLVYVADGRRAAVTEDLATLGDVHAMIERGELVLHDLSDLQSGGRGPVDTRRQLTALATSVDHALAAGWSGARVVAEATAQAADPAWRDNHVGWEQVLDRYMIDHPLSVLCAYDERVVGAETAASLACVHPRRHGPHATFAVYATPDGVSLEGEVDACQAPLLERALATMPPYDHLILDAGQTTFVDAAATGVLARFASRRAAGGTEVCVRRAGPTFRRVWDLLGFSETRALRFL